MAKRKRNKIAENIRNQRRKLIRRIDKLKKTEGTENLVQSLERIVKSSYLRTNQKRGITGTSISGAIANLAEGLRLEDRYMTGASITDMQSELVQSEWRRGALGQTSVYKQGAIDLFYASMANIGHTDREIMEYLQELADKNEETKGTKIENIDDAYQFWLTKLPEYVKEEGFNLEEFIAEMESNPRDAFYDEYVTSIVKIFRRG